MRLMFAVILSLLAPAAALADPAPAAAREDCFHSNNWRSWSAPRGEQALYIRVKQNDVFRVDLSPGSTVRDYGGEYLINEVHGSGWVCSAIDLDLKVSDYNGFSRGIIATGLRKLTPEEVAALPPKDRP